MFKFREMYEGKPVKSCVIQLTKTEFHLALPLSLLRGSCPKNLPGPAPENVKAPDFIQIGSLSAELFPKVRSKVNPIVY